MAKFTVLGASGFIGTHLSRHLRKKGHEVIAPNRGDQTVFERALGYVVYCIGVTTDYWRRPLDTADAHVCVLKDFLRRARFDRLVYLSTVRLYDGLEGTGTEIRELRLNPLWSRHVYDLSKSLGEALAHHAGRPATVARIANVYDDDLAQDDFLCRSARQALGTRNLTIEASPDDGRDYVHVDDVVEALELIALEPRESVYNVASGVLLSNRDLAMLLEQELGCRVLFSPANKSRHQPVIDVGRLKGDFGLQPRSPLERLPRILRVLKTRSVDDRAT